MCQPQAHQLTRCKRRTKITAFEKGVARLVAHEVDHLHGKLYTDRMREEVVPIPVEQYRGTGSSWKY